MCVCVCVCACTYQRLQQSQAPPTPPPPPPPPFTNTCIISSGRKGPVSFSFRSSDTSQTSEGAAAGFFSFLMMPPLKGQKPQPARNDSTSKLANARHSAAAVAVATPGRHLCASPSISPGFCLSGPWHLLLPVHQVPSVCSTQSCVVTPDPLVSVTL